jgi:hypothetical protein
MDASARHLLHGCQRFGMSQGTRDQLLQHQNRAHLATLPQTCINRCSSGPYAQSRGW